MKLTIAYTTYREEPHIEWFYNSLAPQLPSGKDIRIVIVDALWGKRAIPLSVNAPSHLMDKVDEICVCAPKPSVWQGQHRLTAVDFFSASNARNTALCHAHMGGYIAYVDDLSVLMPTWFDVVRDYYGSGVVVSGSYRKAQRMVVEDGVLTGYILPEAGMDYRWRMGDDKMETKMDGRLLLGCTSLWPVWAIIGLNGWPEYLCDGLGFEDSMMGKVAANAGIQFYYSRRMHEVESDDHHHGQTPFLRIDPGKSPDDKSHEVRRRCETLKVFDQGFGPGINHISELIRHMKEGKPWPIPDEPTHEWYTGLPLGEFHNYKHDD